jgi:hypothetical protein
MSIGFIHAFLGGIGIKTNNLYIMVIFLRSYLHA